MPRPKSVVDAFPLNDELDLLRLRVDYLSPHVDHFLVAESPRTFTGQFKPLHLSENLDRFADIAARLTIVTYDAADGATAWDREMASRSAIRNELASMPQDTVALVGDVDEFPSRAQLARLGDVDSLTLVPLETFYRRANWRLDCNTPWLKVIAVPVGDLPPDLHQVRMGVEAALMDGEPGAHLSYMGFGADQLADKLRAFSHTEFQFAAPAAQRVLEVSDRLALDHFGRSNLPGSGVLTVMSRRNEGELHQWLRRRRPEWFATSPRATRTWREMSAAVLHAAMQAQDVDALGRLGTSATLRHPAGRNAIRLRARRLAGKVRHRRRR